MFSTSAGPETILKTRNLLKVKYGVLLEGEVAGFSSIHILFSLGLANLMGLIMLSIVTGR
jgi:hypothetical protein